MSVYEVKADGSTPDLCQILLTGSGEQFLKKGESRDINLICDFEGLSAPRETRDLIFNLTYSYYVDATTVLGDTTESALAHIRGQIARIAETDGGSQSGVDLAWVSRTFLEIKSLNETQRT